jgi:hypothetical protein
MLIIFPYNEHTIISHPTLLSILKKYEIKDKILFYYANHAHKLAFSQNSSLIGHVYLDRRSWLKFLVKYFIKNLKKISHILSPSEPIVAFDNLGFHSALQFKRIFKYKKIIYFNCEISPNLFEKNQIDNCFKFVIQDQFRLQIYQQAMKTEIPISKLNYCPVAHYDILSDLPKENRKDLIYSGSVSKSFGLDKFILNAETSQTIYFQTHWTEDFEYFNGLINKKGYIFEKKTFDNYLDLLLFLNRFKIGLAIYDNFHQDDNFINMSEIGLSSGKISAYSMVGIPILYRGSAALDIYNHKFNFGLSIDKIENLEDSINLILTNYDYYSANARKFYLEILDPDLNLNHIFKNKHDDS